MPRRIPRLDTELANQIMAANLLVDRVEAAMVASTSPTPNKIRVGDVELAYELAYLRVFIAWEILLEQTLFRFMCGYEHANGQESLEQGKTYCRTISEAEALVLNGRPYVLWHNPQQVTDRAAKFLKNSQYEQVIKSAQARLEQLAAVRHRIAHAQTDARIKFDNATMSIAGKRYPASRPGRFLRDWANTTPPQRWFSALSEELNRLARQICL